MSVHCSHFDWHSWQSSHCLVNTCLWLALDLHRHSFTSASYCWLQALSEASAPCCWLRALSEASALCCWLQALSHSLRLLNLISPWSAVSSAWCCLSRWRWRWSLVSLFCILEASLIASFQHNFVAFLTMCFLSTRGEFCNGIAIQLEHVYVWYMNVCGHTHTHTKSPLNSSCGDRSGSPQLLYCTNHSAIWHILHCGCVWSKP